MLSIIVFSNIIQLTSRYLHYPSKIKISINSNEEDNTYPRITLSPVFHDYTNSRYFYNRWNEFLSRDDFKLIEVENKCPDYRESIIYRHWYKHRFSDLLFASFADVLTFYISECWNLTANDLLDERLLKKIDNKYKFKFDTIDEDLSLIDIVDKTRGYRIISSFDYIMIVLILTFNTDKIIKTKNDKILKISFDIDQDIINLNSILFHSQPIPHFKDIIFLHSKSLKNYSVLLTKTKRSYLGPPYSQCSHYRTDTERPFNAMSYMHCYRHCLRAFAQNNNRLNCTPFFIDSTITELDFFNPQIPICSFEKGMIFDELVIKQIRNKCLQLCPNDCLTVDYSSDNQRTASEMDLMLETSNRSEVSIVWDSRQPMLSYIEESVLSFTDYLVICGGLLGLWFGTNANDLFIKLIESRFLIDPWLQIKTKSRLMLHN